MIPKSMNVAAMVIAMIGGAAALLGGLVTWYTPGDGVKLADFVHALDTPHAKAFPKAYFGWLMWVLLAVTVLAALFANAPGPQSMGLRVLSPLTGVLGAALVCVSLNQLIERGSIFDNSGAGLWLVLAGFLVAGFAGVAGPVRAPGPYPPGYPPAYPPTARW